MSEKQMIKIDNNLFYKNLSRIALPIALQSLMLAMVAAADALMLGRVEQIQMTAVSLATQIQFVQNMFLSSATGAGAILGIRALFRGIGSLARHISEKRKVKKLSRMKGGAGYETAQ